MPELPEVETIARGVDARLRNDRIESVWFGEKREPFKTPPRAMAEALRDKRIERVFRVGKHIVFDLSADPDTPAPSSRKQKAGEGKKDTPAATHPASLGTLDLHPAHDKVQWIVHLGMTGRLLVSSQETSPPPPHTHAILRLASGRQLQFVDPRRFGRLTLHTAAAGEAGSFTGTGREPLSISLEEFQALFRARKTPIKAALLNQKLLHGVGNIYADESLFRAGIRPRRLAGRLTRAQFERLHAGLNAVLREAISLGGSSVSDYVDADGVRGFFQLEHRVYLRTGQPCLVCGTPIRKIVLGGRGTHYCPRCQK